MVKNTLRWLPLTVFLLAACNLGQGVPTGDVTPTVDLIIQAQLPTATPGQALPPPTVEAAAQSAAESLGPVTIAGDLLTQTPVSIRVKRGEAVSSVNCLSVHQESNTTEVLGASTASGPSLDGSFDEVFTFTPEQGGTYSVSCTGVALTLNGLREVDAQSSSFSIEAKG